MPLFQVGSYIKDSLDNIFIINHFPCEGFLKAMKISYTMSKFLLVIHDQMWTTCLLGNNKRLQEIISENEDLGTKNEYFNFIQNFKIDQRTYNAADGVICLNDDTYNIIKNTYKTSTSLHKISHGHQDSCSLPVSKLQKKAIRARLNVDINEIIIIYTGRLCKAKGTEVLIKSFCKIAKKKGNVRLILAGTPFEKDYFNQLFALSKEAASRISFLGQVSHLEIMNWYAIADIAVLPSYTEQCSFTGIEMMMYRLPIIASDGFGVRDMFVNNINARIAKIGRDEKEFESNIVEAISEFLNSESKCEILSRSSRKAFEIKHNIKKMIKEYGKLLDSLT